MDPATSAYLREFAVRLMREDFAEASSYLAPWLGEGEAGEFQLRDAVMEKTSEVLAELDGEDVGAPDGFDIDGNSSTIEDLQESGYDLPSELDPEQLEGWYFVSITADEEEWTLYDFWCAVMDIDGELVIGFYQVEDPD